MDWLPLRSEMTDQAAAALKARRSAARIRHFTYSDAVLDNASGGVICNDHFMPPALGRRFDLSKQAIQSIVADATQADTGSLDIAVGYRAGWKNYYHWTTQCLLNTYWLHREGLLEGCVLAVPRIGQIQERCLQLLGIAPEKLYCVDRTGSVRAKTFKVTNVLFALAAHRFPSELRSMAAVLKSGANTEDIAAPRSIYISRFDSHRRRMINEEQLIKALEKLGIAHVSMTGKTLDEQIWILRGAKLIVAPHGAALTNILYAEPGSHLYELLPSSYVVRCYQDLARAASVVYSDSIFESSIGAQHSTVWSVDVDQVCRQAASLQQAAMRG